MVVCLTGAESYSITAVQVENTAMEGCTAHTVSHDSATNTVESH